MPMSPRSGSKISASNQIREQHWKSLPRDAKGRWIKRGSSGIVKKKRLELKKTQVQIPKNTPSLAINKAARAEKILDKIQADFNSHCPRCGGKMKNFRIRCGPEKLVDVNKCVLCNYWIPIQ